MIGPEVNVPDVTEAVVGFRSFELRHSTQHNFCLASPHTGDFWYAKRRTARCNKEIVSEAVVLDGIRPSRHEAPAKDCGCGIYVYHDPSAVHVGKYRLDWPGFDRSHGTPIPAIVTLTGRVEVHARGMRGQYAEIRALGTHERITPYERVALQRIANEWDVPLVPQAHLNEIAREFGLPLDSSMKPAPAELPEALDTSHTFVETVPQHKPWWFSPLVPIGCNIVPLAVNVAMFASTQNPISAASASISAAAIAWIWRGARRLA